MTRDDPTAWRARPRQKLVETPPQRRIVCAPEGAPARQLDDVRWKSGGRGGPHQWCVGDGAHERTWEEDERGPGHGCTGPWQKRPDSIRVLHGDHGVRLSRYLSAIGCAVRDERPGHEHGGR